MQHQSSEYDSVSAESTQLVSRLKWRVVVAGLMVTVAAGITLVVVLANGAANPPRAAMLVENFPSDESFVHITAFDRDDQLLLRLPRLTGMPASKPYTLEATAANSGEVDSGWGFWVDNRYFIVDNQGYALCSDATGQTSWFEFIHLRPNEANTLYLHITLYGNATFRINGEVACVTNLPGAFPNWGILHYRQPQLRWTSILMFAGRDSSSIPISP
jgi:hypothetical protein